jgi:hypothetical protein
MSDPTPAPTKVRTLPVLAAVIVVAATLVMLLALPVLASPVSAPAGSSGASTALAPSLNPAVQQWAYGGTKTITGSLSLTGSSGNGLQLSYHAFYGWTVVFTQTNNTTNSGFQIEAQRTAAAELFVNVCTPNCTSPTWTGNYTASASEAATAFGNFTRDGTVYVDGTPTSALGFLNGSGATQDALHSKLTVTGPVHTFVWYLNVTGSAHAQVYFDPELGLIPYTLTSGESWHSQSNFTLMGAYALSWDFVGPKTQASGNPSGLISANGTVDLTGGYSQDLSLRNGENTHILVLSLTGPFDVFDGVIILPHMGDVFSGDVDALGGQGLGFAPVASTSAVDYDSSSSHFGIAAAATTFAPGSSGNVPTSPAITSMATSTSGGDIQAQPMSVPAAQSCAASLVTGGTCSAAPTWWEKQVGPYHTTVLQLVALSVGVVALVAVLGVAIGRRPKAPPPVRVPNPQARVPEGAGGQIAPPPRTPPQQPSDPLGNLW